MTKPVLFLLAALQTSLMVARPSSEGRQPYDTTMIPAPVFEAEPGYVDLYWKAWELAYDHVKYQDGLVQPLYMDEGLWDDTIWIWDSEFMVLFCKYAPDLYPGIETLDNFYYTMLEEGSSSLRIQHPDNPPFFAWVESEYYKFTNDKAHLRELLLDKRFLQRYFDLFNELNPEMKFSFEHHPMALKYVGDGYLWNGISSGMDNTPRTRKGEILWVDAISQQALSALYISRLAKEVGDRETERKFRGIYETLKRKINKLYWDREDNCYYDILRADGSLTKILTPASFWPVLAGVPTRQQVRRMADFALQDNKLGGRVPWVTVSRDDTDFDSRDGNYWKGAMWLPTAYMAIKSLQSYDLLEEASSTAESVLRYMLETYREYEPHTIWECYSPVAPAPSSNHGQRVRPDFCGWSALGPISLFIENVLGFYEVDAQKNEIKWDMHHDCRHGICNLRFGEVITDIVYENGTVSVKSNRAYILSVNGRKHRVHPGDNTFAF